MMRHDHTDWLIHFVRDRTPHHDPPEGIENELDFHAGGEIELDAEAFHVLKTILRLGGLIPGRSYRSGKTTLYGGTPVVCATEMPIYSFAKYVQARGQAGRASCYGIAFLKHEFHSAGARPVIYGLSRDDVIYTQNTVISRVLDESILPLDEQYRYVPYNPSGETWIDWSHEREWRWKVQNSKNDYVWCEDSSGVTDGVPGLPLFRGTTEGASFTQLRIIVWSKREAEEVQELLTGYYFAGFNDYDTPFCRHVIRNSSIVILEEVVNAVDQQRNLSAQTIEGLEKEQLLHSVLVHPLPENAEAKANSAIAAAKAAGKRAAEEWMEQSGATGGYCGFAHAVTHDVTDPMVQYFLSNELAAGPFDGTVHFKIKGDWPISQSMDYNEYVWRAVSNALESELGVKVYMHSRPD